MTSILDKLQAELTTYWRSRMIGYGLASRHGGDHCAHCHTWALHGWRRNVQAFDRSK